MTKQEEDALKRLEVNMVKLIEIVENQRSIISNLRDNLQASKTEITILKDSNEELKKELSLTTMAKNIVVGTDNNELEAYLGEIIKQVDSCIKKLET